MTFKENEERQKKIMLERKKYLEEHPEAIPRPKGPIIGNRTPKTNKKPPAKTKKK